MHTLAKVKSTLALVWATQASLMALARTPGPQKYVCNDPVNRQQQSKMHPLLTPTLVLS